MAYNKRSFVINDDTKFNDSKNTDKCDKCNGIMTRKYEYGPHVFLDTSLITDPNYKCLMFNQH